MFWAYLSAAFSAGLAIGVLLTLIIGAFKMSASDDLTAAVTANTQKTGAAKAAADAAVAAASTAVPAATVETAVGQINANNAVLDAITTELTPPAPAPAPAPAP